MIKVTNDLSQDFLSNSLVTRKGEQESDSADAEEGRMPTGDTDDSSGALLENAKEVVVGGPPPPTEGPSAQNAVESNPPGPLGLVLGNESLVADDLQ